MPGVHNEFASYMHGSKGSAVVSTNSPHARAHAHLQGPEDSALAAGRRNPAGRTWCGRYPQPEHSPYDWEWDDLIAAIRDDKPYNEVKRGAEASLVASMGRFAAHTGQIVTFDQMMNHDHEFAPDVDKLTLDGPAPLARRPGRQVSGSGAGHQEDPRILKGGCYNSISDADVAKLADALDLGSSSREGV